MCIGNKFFEKAVVLIFLLGSSAAYGQAFSVPRSDEVVQVEVVLPGGAQAKVEVRDGTMVTIRNEDAGYLYGFAMTADIKANRAAVTSVEIFDLSGGGQEIRQLGKSNEDLVSGAPLSIETPHGVFDFRLVNIVTGQFPAIRPLKSPLKSGLKPSQLESIYGKSGGGTCCVSCGSLTFCATKVEMDCGSCDSGGGSGGGGRYPTQ